MKRRISVILICAMILAFAIIFTGCGKQEPVYTGMSISHAQESADSKSRSGIVLMSDEYDGGELNGDYDGKNENVDKEDPFETGEDGENIEEEVSDSLNVVGSEVPIYYAEPGQDIFITIHIDNPDNFEIMSFTLNGEKYSSYMFEYGSDMENIILKRNVGYGSGIVEYTIDAIKYIDGTEIKDVKIGGEKTVLAGIRVENQVSALVENTLIGTNGISFSAVVDDYDSLIEYSKGIIKAVIYDGEEIIAIKDVQLGQNNIIFEGLKTNTLYQYGIFAYYDDLSGSGPEIHTLYSNAVYTDAVVLFDNVVIGEEHIAFSFKWHQSVENKAIVSLKLYKNAELVKEIGVDEVLVDGLLSNNEYEIVAEYMNGDNTESISIEFTTLKKAIPDIEFASSNKTQTSVSFELKETDDGNIGQISKIELLHSTGTVVAETQDVRSFENLLSNNDYKIKVTYTYDLNDGEGIKESVKELDFKTLEKTVPVFELCDEVFGSYEISADVLITNPDSTLLSYKSAIYNGDVLISECQGDSLSFSGLEYYKDYIIRIYYTYNLNDGLGERTASFEKNVKTAPVVNVTDCKIANTSAVSEGETIYLQATLDNPLGLKIKSVTVNSTSYNVTSLSSSDRIFIEIVYNNQFAGGNTELSIEKFNTEIDGNTYTVTPENILSDSVFINGKLEFLEYKFVNEDFEEIRWAFPSDKIYVLLELNNPTGYDVSIPDRSNIELKKLDNNKWYYELSVNVGSLISHVVTEIDYSNAYISGTADVTKHNYIRVVKTDEIRYVSTPNDLLNMNEGYYYELTCDIDLSGLEWHPADFTGVFDGKGYAIKNMSFVKSLDRVEGGNFYSGLFKKGNGVVKNLNIKDATIVVDINADYGYAYVGGIVAQNEMGFLEFENCSVDKNSIFSIKNLDNTYVGGMAGYVAKGYFTDCENNAGINVTGVYTYAGGLVAQLDAYPYGTSYEFDNSVIKNCVNNGNVTSTLAGGGIAGGIYGTLEKCTNNGIISAANAGGISAYAIANAVSCTNNGKVYASSEKTNEQTLAGGLFASLDGCATGCINNVEVSGVSLFESYAGGIMAKSGGAVVKSCVNNANVSAVSNSETAHRASAGGILACGCATILNSANNGEISATANENYQASAAGGIVGEATGDNTVDNCLNTNKIKACYAGGILGRNNNIYILEEIKIPISKCVNAGAIDARYSGGGLVGYITLPYDASWGKIYFEIADCINFAAVSVSMKDSSGNKIIGGIVGNYDKEKMNVTNCYSLIVYHECDNYCTADERNLASFYKDNLNFSETIWDLSNLDVDSGKYPALK